MPSVINTDGGTFTYRLPFVHSIEKNQRQLDEHFNGTFTNHVDADTLSSGVDIAYTHGQGKVFIVVNAGSDLDGTIAITGTTVDRDTGVETGADTENITIDALTTDDSDTDAESNVRHAFTGAYITSKWFRGSVTISTTDVNLSDVDIWCVSFEQVNDTPDLTLQTFDTSFDITNTAAWLYLYLYTVAVTTATKKCNLTRSASLELAVGDTDIAPYRRRIGNLGVTLDGTKDGFWFEAHFGPNNQNYFEDVTIVAWFDVKLSID